MQLGTSRLPGDCCAALLVWSGHSCPLPLTLSWTPTGKSPTALPQSRVLKRRGFKSPRQNGTCLHPLREPPSDKGRHLFKPCHSEPSRRPGKEPAVWF